MERVLANIIKKGRRNNAVLLNDLFVEKRRPRRREESLFNRLMEGRSLTKNGSSIELLFAKCNNLFVELSGESFESFAKLPVEEQVHGERFRFINCISIRTSKESKNGLSVEEGLA